MSCELLCCLNASLIWIAPMLDTLVPTREDIAEVLTLDGFIGFLTIVIVVLWIYMPGYLANTFAMIWGRLHWSRH